MIMIIVIIVICHSNRNASKNNSNINKFIHVLHKVQKQGLTVTWSTCVSVSNHLFEATGQLLRQLPHPKTVGTPSQLRGVERVLAGAGATG